MGVLAGLRLDAGQREANGLGLQRADGLLVDEEQVVRKAGRQRELTHGDALAPVEVARGVVLDQPACGREHGVDLDAGGGFRFGGGGGHGFCSLMEKAEAVCNKWSRMGRTHGTLE